MKAHWTAQSNGDFLFRIVADFIGQIEKKMEKENLSRGKLAKKLRLSKGRVSQVLNNPGNASLLTVIRFARILGLKVSVIAYDDDDPKNTKGPINPEIFETCWEKCEKPHDYWALEAASTRRDIVQPVYVWGKDLEAFTARPAADIARLSGELIPNLKIIETGKEN